MLSVYQWFIIVFNVYQCYRWVFDVYQWFIIVDNIYQCYICVLNVFRWFIIVFNVYQCLICVFNVHQWFIIVYNVYQCYRCVFNVYQCLPDYFSPGHSTRINLRAMILRGSAGRICHLQNVKSYISYVQQCTKIIKKLTLKTYFS